MNNLRVKVKTDDGGPVAAEHVNALIDARDAAESETEFLKTANVGLRACQRPASAQMMEADA